MVQIPRSTGEAGEIIDFTIRAAREEDAQSMVALLNPIIQAGRYTILDQAVTVDGQLDFIRSFPERGVFHVAVGSLDGKLLGMQDVMPSSEEAEVFRHIGNISTFIALELRGQGIGRRLSQATFERAKALGFRKLTAMIRADNPQAVKFYRSLGFRRVGVARGHAFVVGRYIDEVLMEKGID